MLDWIFAWWWVLLIESIVAAGVVALIAMNAHRLVGDAPTSLTSLRVSMLVTAAAIFVAYIALMVGLVRLMESYYGAAGPGTSIVYIATILAALLMVGQWLFSPYIINAVYKTRPPSSMEEESLATELERIARASGVKTPKLVISDLSMPNAFAYGSPLAGNYVAVTRGLLSIMPKDEVVAVLGHEVGHLKHRDISWILALSLIPLAVYFIGRLLIYSGIFGASSRRGNSMLFLMALGVALLVASIIFKFLVAHFNRLREYYADAHSALVTGMPRSLQRALTRIQVSYTSNPRIAEEARSHSTAATLFIVAPLVELSGGFFYDIDYMVEEMKRSETSPVQELFSTHPPVPKRLKFLDRIAARIG